MNRLAILAACATLQGCASYHLEYEHVSHLSAGWPVNKQYEDTIDHVSICGQRRVAEMLYTEGCVGRLVRDGGFDGPSDTAVWRIKIPLKRL